MQNIKLTDIEISITDRVNKFESGSSFLVHGLEFSFSRSLASLRVAAKLDLGLDHLSLVRAADTSF